MLCIEPCLKLFIYLLCSFIKAKSEVSLEDISGLIEFGLELFHVSQNKLYVQVILGVSDFVFHSDFSFLLF